MKILKIILISIPSIFILFYLAFLFILPNTFDLNKYSPNIKKIIQKNTGLNVNINGLKVKTSWDLQVGASIEKTDLLDFSQEKFAQINGLKINISLWHFLLGRTQIDKIEADKILANLDIAKWKGQSTKTSYNKTLLPDISIKKYRISILEGGKNYTIKGDNLKISEFIFGEEVNIQTIGQLILNKRKQINYNIAVKSELSPETKTQFNPERLIKIFDDLYKYNINADLKAYLTVKNKDNAATFDGNIDINRLFFTVNGKTYPYSNLKLICNGDKIKINSSLHIDKNSKAIITGILKTGKHKFIDLQVKSDEIEIKDILLITKAMSKTLGLQKLHNFNAKGLIKANFNLKSNFKKIESNGYLRIKNAGLTNDLYKVSLDALNADIDLSKNALHIIQARANLNGQPVTIKGNIDQNANANLLVLANNLPLKSVLFTSGNTDVLKENNIHSGLVNFSASLTGCLDKATPKINATLTDAGLLNIKSKTRVKLSKAVLNLDSKNSKNGVISILDLNIVTPAASILLPKAYLKLADKDLIIEKTYLYLDGIKTNLSGKVLNISTTPMLSPISISIPNQISVPIKGYPASNALLSGNLLIEGHLSNPKLSGAINIPYVNLPSISTVIKSMSLKFDKMISLNCSHIQIANSIMSLNTQIGTDFSKGIRAENLNFYSSNIDLNYLIPIFKKLPKNTTDNFYIHNGRGNIGHFKIGNIDSTNITTDICFKDDILELNNLLADAYSGKVAGLVKYNTKDEKTFIQMQGRDLSANTSLIAVTGRNNDINGRLDFDGNISISGYSKYEIMKSLKGDVNFIVHNGKMGMLGKFEHLIYAQNIVSNNVFKTTLNVIAKAITVKNTGVYKYMQGRISFSNGWTNIKWIKTSGPSMSLYITGRYYMPDNIASLIMLGRISDDVVRILGPIGEFSMNKAVSSIPKIGEATSLLVTQYTTNPVYENISQIPDLSPKTEFPTKEFKVIIDGDVKQQSSIKSFKWLSKPIIVQKEMPQYISPRKEQANEVPDFVKNLPDFKQ